MVKHRFRHIKQFYSHVICLGTKIHLLLDNSIILFYSHVICLGTKIYVIYWYIDRMFYSHVICLGTKIVELIRICFQCFTVT